MKLFLEERPRNIRVIKLTVSFMMMMVAWKLGFN